MLSVPTSEYDEMTPRQLMIRLGAYQDLRKIEAEEYRIKLKNEKELLVHQAFYLSRWVWAKKISQKDLNDAMGGKKEKVIMTDEEMLKQVMALNAMFGGETINVEE